MGRKQRVPQLANVSQTCEGTCLLAGAESCFVLAQSSIGRKRLNLPFPFHMDQSSLGLKYTPETHVLKASGPFRRWCGDYCRGQDMSSKDSLFHLGR